MPLGTAAYEDDVLRVRAHDVVSCIDDTRSLLQSELPHRMTMWAMLRRCLARRFDYTLQHAYPATVVEHARTRDGLLRRRFQVWCAGHD